MVNRYDGIDLPGDACRVLVIDGLPDVRSLKDKIEQAALSGSKIYNARQIQRIEQGIGRGIRSNEDYCAVLLMEARLTHMLNSPGALEHLTPPTRAQLELSKRVAEQIEGKGLEAIEQVIGILTSRAAEWVGAAKNALIDLGYKTSSKINSIIVQERRAFDTASRGLYQEAVEAMQVAIDQCEETDHKAWLLQRKAEYMHHINQVESQRILTSATQQNHNVLKPLQGIHYKKIQTMGMDQAQQCARFLNAYYRDANDLIIGVNSLLSRFVFGVEDTSKDFEVAMELLASHLGFTAQRPEQSFNKGPDVLWEIGALKYLVISCKNEATTDTIFKRYADELSGHVNWFRETYDHTCSRVPVIMHQSRFFDQNASPPADTRIITQEKMEALKTSPSKVLLVNR
jgi:hypothetical protein